MTPPCHLLFVYGTLKRSSLHPMARFLAQHAEYVGTASINARLFNLGRYPGMIASEHPGDWVHGDLYDLTADPSAWKPIDAYEAIESPGEEYFERALARVRTASGPREAWVYWYRGEPSADSRIVSGKYGE